jgi:hypothetical protein
MDDAGKGSLADGLLRSPRSWSGNCPPTDRKFRRTLRVFLDRDHRPGRGVNPMPPLTDGRDCFDMSQSDHVIAALHRIEDVHADILLAQRDIMPTRRTSPTAASCTRAASP